MLNFFKQNKKLIFNHLDFLGPIKPRYVRVNTLVLGSGEAIQNFQEEDWTLSKFSDKNDYDGFLGKISTLDEAEFMADIHIPDLLIFPPKTEFHNHPAYQKMSILLQDKVICKQRKILYFIRLFCRQAAFLCIFYHHHLEVLSWTCVLLLV